MQSRSSSVALVIMFVSSTACATRSPPTRVAPLAGRAVLTSATTPVERRVESPDTAACAERDASEVFEAMHADLLGCYVKRLAGRPDAHAFLTIDVVIGADGRVQDVETTGGALLGDAAMSCIKRRVRRARFAAPSGGGTSHIRVPLAFRPGATGEDA